EVEIDEGDPSPDARQRDGQIRNGGRLALTPHCGSNNDRARRPVKVDEFEAGSELSKRLSVKALRLLEHHEFVLAAQAAFRWGNAAQERDLKRFLDFSLGADPAIEGLNEKCQTEADYQAEHAGENCT